MYQALYREYRPQTFDELYGQEHVTTTLKNQVQSKNIGHAYLFSGTRGTGKTSAAKIFSRAVNCLDPVEGNPCNKCKSCKEIINESTMDVIEMDAASNNSVEDIRDLRDRVIYPPSNIDYKVYIIDEVHMLSKGAFNALLKTLEEPPSHLIFILATTEQERLPQTILSRCQRFDFKRITNEDIILNMKNIVSDKGINIDDDVLKLIARNSDGAMRDALSLLDQCISYDEEEVTYEDAINILGVTNVDLLFNLVDKFIDNDTEGVLFTIDEIISEGKDIQQFIKDLIIHYRNLMILKSSKNSSEILSIDNLEKYIEQANKIELEYILNVLKILSEAETQTKWSSQPRINLEMASIQILNLEYRMTLEERIERLESGYIPKEESNKTKNKVVKQNKPIKTQIKNNKKQVEEKQDKQTVSGVDNNTDIDLSFIEKEWENIMNEVRSRKVNIYALLIEGYLNKFENDLLTIGYDDDYGFHMNAINKEDNKKFVEEIISSYFNRDIRVDFVMGKKKQYNIINDNDIQEKEVGIDKDNAIKKVIDTFGEDIVEIK